MDVLKFKMLDGEAILPTRHHESDAGLDIYALEDTEVPPTEIDKNFVGVNIGQVRVPTGVAVEIPKGYYGKVVGRSGLAFNHNIGCFEGTIDSPYRGEIGVLLYNLSGRPYFVRKGDRIAQLIIMKCELPTPIKSDELSVTDRGEDGYGSSGR